MSAYLLSEVQNRIQPWAVRNLPPEHLGNFTDEEFVDLVNKVANDLNIYGAINIERCYETLSAGNFNHDVGGVIMKVFWIFYEDGDYKNQYWGFVDDTLVFKETPGGDVQLDLEYLRKCEDVEDLTDEIDLPEQYMPEFLNLVKDQMKVEFGLVDDSAYMASLTAYGQTAARKKHDFSTKSRWRHWLIPAKGDDLYDITENYVSQDTIYLSAVDGLYYFTD